MATVNCSIINMGVQVSSFFADFNSLGCKTKSGIVDHMLVQCFQRLLWILYQHILY
jgi:hypothetical protein